MKKKYIAKGINGAYITRWGFIGYSLLCILAGWTICLGSFFIAQYL